MKISNIFMYISVIEISTQSINYYGTEGKKKVSFFGNLNLNKLLRTFQQITSP